MISKPKTKIKKHEYSVIRPFVYKKIAYKKGDIIRASRQDLKFLIRNNLIK